MEQRDTTDLNANMGQLTDALYQLQEISDDSNSNGYSISSIAYSSPQRQAQQALIDLMHAADRIVGSIDEFTTAEGVTVPLPNPPLERGPDGLPKFPQTPYSAIGPNETLTVEEGASESFASPFAHDGMLNQDGIIDHE